MHVEQALRASALVQVVDVLRDQQELSWPFRIQLRERAVCGVGLDRSELGAPRIVERMDQSRIAAKRFRSRYILDAVPLPQSIRPTERRNAAFSGNAGAGEDHDVADIHARIIEWPRNERSPNPHRRRRLDLPA